VQNFFGNWLWWHACALAHNTARWIRDLALPRDFRRCRGKRLRLAFFNVAARVVTHARQLWLRIPRSHAWADAFIEALTRIRALPAFAEPARPHARPARTTNPTTSLSFSTPRRRPTGGDPPGGPTSPPTEAVNLDHNPGCNIRV
jgi:hypothetical protein